MTTESGYIGSNLERFYLELATLGGYEEGASDKMVYAWNRKGTWPAHVVGIPDAGSIRHLSQSMQDRKLPPFLIAENTASLDIEALEEQGIRTVREWTGMILYPPDFRPAAGKPGLSILVNDPDTRPDWEQLVNVELLTSSNLDMHLTADLFNAPSFSPVVAYDKEAAAGAGLLYTTDGISGIYLVATRKDKRKRGIGSSLCTELVQQAWNRDSRAVVLHATGMAVNMYKGLGFRVVNRYLVLWKLGIAGR